MRLESHEILTSISLSPGRGSSRSMTGSLSGSAPCIVSGISLLAWHPTHDLTAEEEISRRKQYSKTQHVTPTETTATDPAATVNPARVIHSPLLTPPPPTPPSRSPSTPTIQPRQSIQNVSPPLRPDSTTVGGRHPRLVTTPMQSSPGQTNDNDPGSSPVVPPLSCPHSPSPGVDDSIPTTGDSDQTANEQPPAAPTTNRVGRVPPAAGTFVFNGKSTFVTSAAVEYLHTIRAGQPWEKMITSYLRLEELPVVKGVCIIFCYPSSYTR